MDTPLTHYLREIDVLRLADNASSLATQPVCGPPPNDVGPILKNAINDVLPARGSPLFDAAHFHFQNYGKLLRGKTALDLGKVVGLERSRAIDWAVAVELMHNASLVHDDICDDDKFRRDRTSIMANFGTPLAVCFGDWLVARSFESALSAIGSNASISAISLLASAMRRLSEGEASEFSGVPALDWDFYERIVLQKTVPLILAPIEGPLVLTGREEALAAVREAMEALGIAYQISNDMLDVMNKDGRNTGFNDLRKGAPNAVSVCFRDLLDKEERIDFDDWMSGLSDRSTEQWITLFSSSNALEACSKKLETKLEDFRYNCAVLPDYLMAALEPMVGYLEGLTSSTTARAKLELELN